MTIYEVIISAILTVIGLTILIVLGKFQYDRVDDMSWILEQYLHYRYEEKQLSPVSLSKNEKLMILGYLLSIVPISYLYKTTQGQMVLFFVIMIMIVVISLIYLIATVIKIKIWLKSPIKY